MHAPVCQLSVEGSWRSCRGRFALDPAADLLTSHTVYNQRFAVPLLHLAVPLLCIWQCPYYIWRCPYCIWRCPYYIHMAVPLLHLAAPLLHLAVPLLHIDIDSRRWSLEIEGKYMVAYCFFPSISWAELPSGLLYGPLWPHGSLLDICTPPGHDSACAVQNALKSTGFSGMRMRSGRPELIWPPSRTRPTARPQSGMGQGNSPAAAGRPEGPG
jgi:hypothetical protein